MELIPYLRQAAQKLGPSGHEGEISKWLQGLFAPLCDEVTIDRMYNVIAGQKGTVAPDGLRTLLQLAVNHA